jgi:hypothetical protein
MHNFSAGKITVDSFSLLQDFITDLEASLQLGQVVVSSKAKHKACGKFRN